MRAQLAPVVNVFPDPQDVILLEHCLDPFLTEALADGAAVLMIHDALRLIENFPAALPGQITEVGILEVKRLEQRVKAAQLEEFSPVEGAGTAASVEARILIADIVILPVP